MVAMFQLACGIRKYRYMVATFQLSCGIRKDYAFFYHYVNKWKCICFRREFHKSALFFKIVVCGALFF